MSLSNVPTPAGIPISKVHQIPPGGRVAHVGNEIHLIDGGGNTIHKATREETIHRSLTEASTEAIWKYTGSLPIQNFKATWTVPPNPTTHNDQTIFLFIATLSADSNSFFEAVLQWGPSKLGGGPYWSVFCFYYGLSHIHFSSVIKVAVGDSLEAVINLTSHKDTSFDYTCGFSGIPESLITVTGAPEQVQTLVKLQSDAVTQPSDYPAGNTAFKNIYISLTDSTYPSLTWSTVDDVVGGLSTTVNVDGSHDGKVTVNHQAK